MMRMNLDSWKPVRLHQMGVVMAMVIVTKNLINFEFYSLKDMQYSLLKSFITVPMIMAQRKPNTT